MLWCISILSQNDDDLTKDMEIEPVKKRRSANSDVLTIPALFAKVCKRLRENNIYFQPRLWKTQEGRLLLIFEEVKNDAT